MSPKYRPWSIGKDQGAWVGLKDYCDLYKSMPKTIHIADQLSLQAQKESAQLIQIKLANNEPQVSQSLKIPVT